MYLFYFKYDWFIRKKMWYNMFDLPLDSTNYYGHPDEEQTGQS